MKKKVMVIGILVIVVAVVIMAGWYVLFCYMGIGPAFPFLPEKEIGMENMQDIEGDVTAGEQLMALVETEEEAENIATQYGIEFVSFSDGVAVYRTEEDPAEVIARGQTNGYPTLYLNRQRTIMMSTD